MKGRGAIRMGLACALLFASLSLVVWRQSRVLEALRALDAARAERVLLQAERSRLQGEIQRLESRARVLPLARERLGLRVPDAAASEIIILGDASARAGESDVHAAVRRSAHPFLILAERR